MKIKGILSGPRITVRDINAIEKYIFLGDDVKKLKGFSIIEGLYLVEKGILEVYDKEKKMTFEDLMEKGKILTDDENFYIKYVVFRDIANKGYIVATGFKFGVDFRVYDKGIKDKSHNSNIHSKFLVKVVPEEYVCSFPTLSGDVRLAKAVNKNLVYAVVDKDSDIIYYQIDLAKI